MKTILFLLALNPYFFEPQIQSSYFHQESKACKECKDNCPQGWGRRICLLQCMQTSCKG